MLNYVAKKVLYYIVTTLIVCFIFFLMGAPHAWGRGEVHIKNWEAAEITIGSFRLPEKGCVVINADDIKQIKNFIEDISIQELTHDELIGISTLSAHNFITIQEHKNLYTIIFYVDEYSSIPQLIISKSKVDKVSYRNAFNNFGLDGWVAFATSNEFDKMNTWINSKISFQ